MTRQFVSPQICFDCTVSRHRVYDSSPAFALPDTTIILWIRVLPGVNLHVGRSHLYRNAYRSFPFAHGFKLLPVSFTLNTKVNCLARHGFVSCALSQRSLQAGGIWRVKCQPEMLHIVGHTGPRADRMAAMQGVNPGCHNF